MAMQSAAPCPAPSGQAVYRIPGFKAENETLSWFIGVPVSSILGGLLLLQTGLYFAWYSKDNLFNRATVILLTCMSIALWGIDLYGLIFYGLDARDNDCMVASPPRSLFVTVLAMPFFALVSQTWFAARAYRLCGHNKYILVLFVVLIMGGMAATIAGLAIMPMSGPIPFDKTTPKLLPVPAHGGLDLIKRTEKMENCMMAAVLIDAGTDLIATLVLVIKLVTLRQDWNHRTDELLVKIAVLSVATGAITSTAALIEALMMPFLLNSNDFPLILGLWLPYIYANCCVGALNLRQFLSGTEDGSSRRPSLPSGSFRSTGITNHTATIGSGGGGIKRMRNPPRGGPGAVSVDVESFALSDSHTPPSTAISFSRDPFVKHAGLAPVKGSSEFGTERDLSQDTRRGVPGTWELGNSPPDKGAVTLDRSW